GDAGEGRNTSLQRGRIALQYLQILAAPMEAALHDRADEVFLEYQVVGMGGEGDLRLDHPELGQVAARLGLLGAEGGDEAEDLAEADHAAFDIQLAGLRQIGVAQIEVLGREQVRGALSRHRCQDGRIEAHEALVVQPLLRSGDHLGADAQQRVLLGRAHPQVAVLHQELDAVLLGLDRILRRDLDDLDVGDIKLIPARRTIVGSHRAGDPAGALQGQLLGRSEDLLRHILLEDHALNHPAAVAQADEDQLALLSLACHPAGQRDGLAIVAGDLRDRSAWEHGHSTTSFNVAGRTSIQRPSYLLWNETEYSTNN